MILTGKWINVNATDNTLEIYKEGDKNILFDNSFYPGTNLAICVNNDGFKKEFTGLRAASIKIRSYKSNETYIDYSFSWIERGVKLKIPVQAIKPQLSAIKNPAFLSGV
ncbi:MAG: hypothetical protein ACM3H8_08490 [Sphingobacteriales bacterium]